jgi:hypothetical protein
MRRGCIAVGGVYCDGCGRAIKHPERYLATDEEGGKVVRYCIDCCLQKGYADYKKVDRGEQILTLFTGEAGK